MVFKPEEKGETTAHDVLNLTLILQFKLLLHTSKISCRLTYFN